MDNRRDEIAVGVSDICARMGLISPGEKPARLRLLGAGGLMDSLTAMRFAAAVRERFQVDVLEDLNLDCLEDTETLCAYILRHRRTVGRQLTVDCSHCPPRPLDDPPALQVLVRALAKALGTEVLKEDCYRFQPKGVTAFAIVSASHIAVHSWPEYHYLSVDIFSCHSISERAVLAVLREKMPGASCACRAYDRVAAIEDGTPVQSNLTKH